jgi:hypothetical protein
MVLGYRNRPTVVFGRWRPWEKLGVAQRRVSHVLWALVEWKILSLDSTS